MNISIEDFVFDTMLKIKNKSEWTYIHCKQVGNLAVSFGKKLKLSSSDLKTLRYMGYLHDTGKLYIDDKILNSNRDITFEEYEEIKKHPLQGYDYLNKNMPECENRDLILAACLFHHYREDKKGYPTKDNLTNISDDFYMLSENRLVEIICICDAFNAIISDRPYSKGKNISEALDIIIYNARTQFDEELSFLFYNFIKEYVLKKEHIYIEDVSYEDVKLFIDLILDKYNRNELKIDNYKLEHIIEYNLYILNKLGVVSSTKDISFSIAKETFLLYTIQDLILELDFNTILLGLEDDEDINNIDSNQIDKELNEIVKIIQKELYSPEDKQ